MNERPAASDWFSFIRFWSDVRHPLHKSHATEIKRAQAKIHSMSLRIYDSKHDFVYSIFKPFIKAQARKVRF